MSASVGTKSPSLDALGAGDSYLVTDILSGELSDIAFAKVKEEVKWATMYHRSGEVPRLVAVEGEMNEDGSFPIYRHPADHSPPLRAWSPTVVLIRDQVQKIIHHPVNHVLIQHYRSGKDHISEHSDKTIDVVQGSNIVNLSLGAQRTMILRTKKDQAQKDGTERIVQRFALPHNSMFVMGPETNTKWLHGINPDNRPVKVKSEEEMAEGCERISLTFRYIGTFLAEGERWIWGQGAKGKTREMAREIVIGGTEGHALIVAFGKENHESDFRWEETYGEGFDVLHFSEPEVVAQA